MDGLNYIAIGYNFHRLAINAIEEMSKHGNKSIIFSEDDLSQENYDELTKWNDNNIAIPILFNFFHGMELIIKGLILHCGGCLEPKTHKLTDLFIKLKNCPSPPCKELLNHINDILQDNGFEDFFKENNTSTDSFYEVFKYPEFKNGDKIKFWMVRGGDEAILERFQKIGALASQLKAKIIKWKSVQQRN